ncbi:MAG: FAD-dependent oxidoreductase [Proteobacteria bacterium]|nr:FAD-dependent oxidoreductase [Pseudomonadota bacterium]MBU1714072.1 FAD-dependent oxidoreductase [Pseudomonadota bacterium]
MQTKSPVIIIGGGPAGLAAAHQCLSLKMQPIVFEMNNLVGGISRTEVYKDYLFDIGGHRFFTRMENIDRLWQEMMGDDFLTVSRRSRIFYQGRLYDYPLKATNALLNLGIIESLLIIASYLKAQVCPLTPEANFEQWVANRFGWRLYRTFFKTYTEKVWGMPCDQIQAAWAAQRIKGLSLKSAVINAMFGGGTAKSLIDSFKYPRKGPGMMWERFKDHIEHNNGSVLLNSKTESLRHENGRIIAMTYRDTADELHTMPVEQMISSIPVSRLIKLLDPAPPAEVLAAADTLSYRSFLIVGLIINKKGLFPDQWLYIHSPEVKVGRIQNFGNWSAAMVPDPDKSSIGMEYFCTIGDTLWQTADADLIKMASAELTKLGLLDQAEIIDGTVIRQPLAYPVYDAGYNKNLLIIREFLATIGNLQTIGRNGMHRYNNMDHSMQTGIMAAKNVNGAQYNLWTINEEDSYLEAETPTLAKSTLVTKLLSRSFARMDEVAFATATGTLAGLVLFLATIWLLIRGGDNVGQHLKLIGQYFIGYSVTMEGAFIALAYAFFSGFLFGWSLAYLRNLFLTLYLYQIKKKNEMMSLKDLMDQL